MKPSLNITKLDAAKRQLESAIFLYFYYCDPVSIHTLSAAAYNVLRDLNEKRGGELMVKDMWQFLDAKKKKDFYQQVNEAENFFKHANNDHDGLYTLNPEWTEALLTEASRKYIELTEEYPPYLHLFLIWFVIRHPDMFRELPDIMRVLDSVVKLNIDPNNRRQFFVEFLPAVTRLPGA